MKKVELLMIEDSKADILLLTRSLKKSKFDFQIEEIYDGEQALMFLEKCIELGQSYYPDLILLDLNLPKIDGYQLLKKIKTDGRLRNIPVFTYSSSVVDMNFLNSYNVYPEKSIFKPKSLKEADAFVSKLDSFVQLQKFVS